MSVNELPKTHRAGRTRGACTVLVAGGDPVAVQQCLASLRAHVGERVEVVEVAPDTASVELAIERTAPADVVLIERPCLVGRGLVERLAEAADSDTNVATASALSDAGAPLALGEREADVRRRHRATRRRRRGALARAAPATQPRGRPVHLHQT